MSDNALLKRLADGGNVVVAEGYVFECERRGYLKAGAFVPEVVLEHPDLVESLTEEFVHAGSDVALACTYYGHREKLRLIGREGDLEKMNRKALEIAKRVSQRTGTLFAGNISNSTLFEGDNEETHNEVEGVFKEQIEWAVEAGVDYIVGETFSEFAEAMLALKCILKYGKGVPAVITLMPLAKETTRDDVPLAEACRRLEEAGAAVVGLNCTRGPATILPAMQEIRSACKGPIAAVPVPYRTTAQNPTFISLIEPFTGKLAFPIDLPAHACSRSEIRAFAEECKGIGVEYVGLCCGNASHYMREVAQVYGRNPPASRYAPNMSEHMMFGDNSRLKDYYLKGLVARHIDNMPGK